MRSAALAVVRAVLLAGPTVLAFFDGGYFTGPRLAAAIVAWVCVAVAALALERRPGATEPGTPGARAYDDAAHGTAARWADDAPAPAHAGERLLPRGAALAALGGLALFAGFTALSAAWAPLGGPAADATERAVLYLGAVFAAFLAFRPRAAARAAEPALALGALVVIGYGLAGRVLPDVVDLERTLSAGGRLDQPLSYWNGEGALAAIGFVLAARIAGDRARPHAMRAAAAAAAAPLGIGVYLTFSRGALTALAVGLAVLLALTPTWRQLRAIAIALEGAIALVIVAALLPSVEDAGRDGTEGAVMLAAILAVTAGAAALQAWSARAEDAEITRIGPLPWFHVRTAAWVAAIAMAVAPFVASAIDRGDASFGAGAQRFTNAGSHRFDYWEAAVKAFADDPAAGGGAGSFAVAWLEHRDIDEPVRDAHSLELETLAELGLIGFALLALALGGIVAATVSVVRHDPGLAAGPAAALAVWGAHSAIDWDWELPAVTLVAAVLAGVLLARAQRGAELHEERPLAPQGEDEEHAYEEHDLDRHLPGGPFATPQQPAYRES